MTTPTELHFLDFEWSENGDGVHTLEAMLSSTDADEIARAKAEAEAVLAWAWRRFPDLHGPHDEGMVWDHDLQLHSEADGWHSLTLTLTGVAAFADELRDAFVSRSGD